MLEKVFGKMGDPIKDQMIIYKAVVQVVLLYGSEILMIMDTMVTVLEVFHHSITRRIAGMIAQRGDSG